MGERNAPCADEPWRLHLRRIVVGIVAGIVVALVRAAADHVDFAANMAGFGWEDLALKIVGYSLVPMILGAVGGLVSDERKVHKIFWVAISGPVIIAAAASGWAASKTPQALPVGKAGWNFEQVLPIAPAYADEAGPSFQTMEAPKSSVQPENPFVSGLKEFLGANSQGGLRYRVVVASINDYQEAVKTAARLNSMKVLPAPATVGEKKFGNQYFPIVIDGWLTLQEAKQLRDRVSGLDLGLPDPPYVSIRDY